RGSTKSPERSLRSSSAAHTAGVTGKGRRCYRGQTRTRRPNRSARPVRRWGLVLNMAPTAGLGQVGVLYYTPDASEVSCTNTGVLFAVKPRRLGRSGLQLKMYRARSLGTVNV